MSDSTLTALEKAVARMFEMTDAEYEQHKRLHPEEALTRQTPAERARERREAAERERDRGLVRDVLAEREEAK